MKLVRIIPLLGLVVLLMFSVNGCFTSKNDSPQASFTVNPREGAAPLTVQVDGTESSDDKKISSYEWSFGDGATASGSKASHTYREPGDYEVSLTVTDKGGASDTGSREVSVSNSPPKARLSATPDAGSSPLQVRFDVSESRDTADSIREYELDFGDGNFVTGSDLLRALDHTYRSPGTYKAVLTVTDSRGMTDVASVTVEVTEPPNRKPTAAATGQPTEGGAPLETTFDASGSVDKDGSISSYRWDFDDGTTARGRRVTHTFESAGEYEVRLVVTDDGGLTDDTAKKVTVSKSYYQIGQTADNGYLQVTLREVNTVEEIRSWKAGAEERFVLLELAVKAIHEGQYPSKIFFFKLNTPAGETRTVNLATCGLEDYYPSKILDKGQTVQGKVAYKVRSGSGKYTLVYNHPNQPTIRFRFVL